jgi:predicted RNA polymerase sigma factor
VNAAVDSSDGQPSAEDAALARIVRREAGLIVAQLQNRLRNFDIAEEAVQEAIVIALRTWRRDGVPANPDCRLPWQSVPAHVIRLNHAIALSHLRGPAAALAEVDQVADRLSGYHLWHATRAQLLTALGDHAAARAANERALASRTIRPNNNCCVHGWPRIC